MTWMLWIVGLAVGAVVVDRAALWAERRGFLLWRHSKRSSATAAMMGAAFEVFTPSYANIVEERERVDRLVVQHDDGDASGPLR